MRVKTIVEFLTLSASIYHLTKDTRFLEKVAEFTEKSKKDINDFASRSELDEEGNEMELMDKILQKAGELKAELDEKIEEMVIKFYQNINVAHADDMKALEARFETTQKEIALLEARLNHLESSD